MTSTIRPAALAVLLALSTGACTSTLAERTLGGAVAGGAVGAGTGAAVGGPHGALVGGALGVGTGAVLAAGTAPPPPRGPLYVYEEVVLPCPYGLYRSRSDWYACRLKDPGTSVR